MSGEAYRRFPWVFVIDPRKITLCLGGIVLGLVLAHIFVHSYHYFVITPNPDSSFSVPASGIPPYSQNPTSDCDRIVAVSGYQDGWHIYGEESNKIQLKEANGKLTKIGKLID